MAEISEATALQAVEDKLLPLTYLGQTIGQVRAFDVESYSIPLQEVLWNTSNPYNCLWTPHIDQDQLTYETVQVGAQRRLLFSMRVAAWMRRQSTKANRSLFHMLCQTVMTALAHSDFQGMGLGVAGAGTQNDTFLCRYTPPQNVSNSVMHRANITFRLYNAATQT